MDKVNIKLMEGKFPERDKSVSEGRMSNLVKSVSPQSIKVRLVNEDFPFKTSMPSMWDASISNSETGNAAM